MVLWCKIGVHVVSYGHGAPSPWLLVRSGNLPEWTVHPLLSHLVAHLGFVDRQRSDPAKSKEWTNYML
jgi:hypothetical protein